jgi:adenosylcobyric acid synthase
MVLGTSSGAGKSLMSAALCRVLRRHGERPLPFKGQNMSLNAWVDAMKVFDY